MDQFHDILRAAVERHVSDVHLKVGGPVIFRVSRQLETVDFPIPTNEWMEALASEITPPHARAKLENDGEVDFSYHLPGVGRFRTNVFRQRGELAMAMRYVKTDIPDFEELGLLPVVREMSEAHRGIVLVAGTTGSGKSTTLAAMIQHVNRHFRKHIVTLEDPIEYVFDDIQSVVEQREIGLDTGGFGAGLKHVVRQDPDIIMIGEMRDAASFAAAMSSADTGHLVLSTLHTTNAAQSVTRILDFFRPEEREQTRRQLANTLLAVVCQRMTLTVDGGITPALEVLINSPTVRKLIEENRLEKLPAAIETGTEEGMINFNQALFNLVKSGKVSKQEAMAKATNPQALEMNFKGIFLDEGRRILG
ncbi:MAG TPA: PilT/PilU family type 4a pilus ATPase [Verrucomicrobiae bacterium]|jgi:twitching motility protein PilT